MDNESQNTPVGQQPVPPPQEHSSGNSMAATPSLGRIVLISLGVLTLGLAIAYGGFYFGQKNSKPVIVQQQPTTPTVTQQPLDTMKPTLMPNTKRYTNTTYSYSIDYPMDLQIQGEGMEVIETTAPEVLFAPQVNLATPDPKRVFHITVEDKKYLGTIKPLEQQTQADLTANMQNTNTFSQLVSTVSATTVANMQAFTFTITSKGFSGLSRGWLWGLGTYTATEFETEAYRFLFFYSNTPEMQQMAKSFQLVK